MHDKDRSQHAARTCSQVAPDQEQVKLGVVIPLGNEEKTIDELLDRLLPHIRPQDQVFCVVDEVSRDSTRERIEARSAVDPRIRLIWAPENRSVVDAYFRGYIEALAADCDWILEMDAGLSHAPEQIPRFLRAMHDGFDFAAGSRFMGGGSHTGSWYRYAISWGGTLLANLLLGTKMRDMTSGFECFTHRALSFLVERGVQSKGPFFQTEIRYALRNWSWVEVPIDYVCSSSAVGPTPILESFQVLWRMFRQSRRSNHVEARH